MRCYPTFAAGLLLLVLAAAAALALLSPAAPSAAQTVIATIQVSENGFGVGVNPVTGLGYVGMRSKIGVLDLATNTQLRTVTVTTYATDIGQIVVHTRLNRIYAQSGWAFVVDGVTEKVLMEIHGDGTDVALDEEANLLYYGYNSSYVSHPDRLYIYDALTGAQKANIELGTSYYYQGVRVAANPATRLGYAAYTKDDSLYVASGATYTIVRQIVFSDIYDVEVDPAGGRVYVVDGSSTVVLDAATHAELGRIAGLAGRLLANPHTGRVYAVSNTSTTGKLTVADGAGRVVLGSVLLPMKSSGLHHAIDPLTGRIYIHASGTGNQDKYMVVQDLPAPPTATPTLTPTRTPTPTVTPTPLHDRVRYLPAVVGP